MAVATSAAKLSLPASMVFLWVTSKIVSQWGSHHGNNRGLPSYFMGEGILLLMVLEDFPFGGYNVRYRMFLFSFLILAIPKKENAATIC